MTEKENDNGWKNIAVGIVVMETIIVIPVFLLKGLEYLMTTNPVQDVIQFFTAPYWNGVSDVLFVEFMILFMIAIFTVAPRGGRMNQL